MSVVKDPVVWINVAFLAARMLFPGLADIMDGTIQMGVLAVLNGGMAIYRRSQDAVL